MPLSCELLQKKKITYFLFFAFKHEYPLRARKLATPLGVPHGGIALLKWSHGSAENSPIENSARNFREETLRTECDFGAKKI